MAHIHNVKAYSSQVHLYSILSSDVRILEKKLRYENHVWISKAKSVLNVRAQLILHEYCIVRSNGLLFSSWLVFWYNLLFNSRVLRQRYDKKDKLNFDLKWGEWNHENTNHTKHPHSNWRFSILHLGFTKVKNHTSQIIACKQQTNDNFWRNPQIHRCCPLTILQLAYTHLTSLPRCGFRNIIAWLPWLKFTSWGSSLGPSSRPYRRGQATIGVDKSRTLQEVDNWQ